MKKTLTVVLIALLSVACLVTIIIGLSGNTKTAANPDIAEPVSTRIIEAPKGDANAADAAHDKVIEGPSQRLPNAAAGTVTWLPKPGDLIEFGTALYAVDNTVSYTHLTLPTILLV